MLSIVSFSPEKEAEEPWLATLIFLGDVMMDPDPEQLYKQVNTSLRFAPDSALRY